MTIKAANSILIKESFHHGVAVPMTLEDYEKEVNQVKKQKVASSTPKEGISTWILLNNPTTKTEIKIPAYRAEDEKKTTKVSLYTTKKRNAVTSTPKLTKAPVKSTQKPSPKPSGKPSSAKPTSAKPSSAKPSQKPNPNKLLTKIKVSVLNDAKNVSITSTTVKPLVSITTKKVYKRTTSPPTTTQKSSTVLKEEEEEEEESEDEDESLKLSRTTVATPFLVLEAKDAEYNLPQDRSPTSPANKKTKIQPTKMKKKKTTISRIKKKSDVKKPGDTKLGKKPEKPITTQIYQYLAREVMPSVGAGLVGLVVTAGLASYFLGGPLTALRRSYDISQRKDDGVFDRLDDFNGNAHAEEEMFGKVIAGMPENSAYRNNIRVHSYRAKQPYQQQPQQYSGYAQYAANNQKQYQKQQEVVQQPQIRYRTIGYGDANNDNSYNRPQYRPQYVQQQETHAKSAPIEYSMQIDAQPEVVKQQPKINVDMIELTTSQPEYNNLDYDEQAKNYYQTEQEVQTFYKPEPASEEKVIQVTPQNHKMQDEEDKEDKPQAAALGSVTIEDEYQNSIANNILSKRKQFVVGSVVPESIEDKISGVPEHGPRRRRKRNAVPKSKSLQNNEIDGEHEVKIESADLTTFKSEIIPETTITNVLSTKEENCTQTYEMTKGSSGLVDLLRRIVDLKVRLTVSFLQNATSAFQEYLRGVESRVNNFMPFIKTNSSSNSPTETEMNTVSEPIKSNVIYKKYW